MAAATMNGNWSYAVPLEETDGNAQTYPARADSQDQAPKSTSRRPSVWDLQSDTESANQRRASVRASNVATASRKRSRNALRDNKAEKEKPGKPDDSAWIHRDKLAQIEIKEMEEAGYHVRQSRRSESAGASNEPSGRRTSRSVSRSGPRRRMSHDRHNGVSSRPDEDYAAAYPTYEELERKRISTVPSQPEEETFDPTLDTEFRTPEELAAEQHEHSQRLIRPSTSRIPISVASSVPVSQHFGRESPLPRSRAGSGAWSKEWDALANAKKARSGSMNSGVLLDDAPALQTTPPGSSNQTSSNGENSPPKSRVPRKAGPAGRKASANEGQSPRPGSSHQNKNRNVSLATSKRPTSSGGSRPRPSTGHANAPEGEPPWLAGMYKPDPRLPPDQQMLPTHAKRMAQEQWEKEGKTGTAYDREFRLLNDDEFHHKPAPPTLSLDNPRFDSNNTAHNHTNLRPEPSPQLEIPASGKASPAGSVGPAWPLTSKSDAAKSDSKSETASIRPGTSGGYKITPTIPSTPTIERPPTAKATQTATQLNPTPRIPDLDEKDEAKAKKGCCCVVM